MPESIRGIFATPTTFSFQNTDSTVMSAADRLKVYEEEAKKHGTNYPVMIKAQAANRSKYSHIFFVCKNAQGMQKALDFEGYVNSLIMV